MGRCHVTFVKRITKEKVDAYAKTATTNGVVIANNTSTDVPIAEILYFRLEFLRDRQNVFDAQSASFLVRLRTHQFSHARIFPFSNHSAKIDRQIATAVFLIEKMTHGDVDALV
jgi:hypothetical protein